VNLQGQTVDTPFATLDPAPAGSGYAKQAVLSDGTLYLNANGETSYQHAGRRFLVTAVNPGGTLEYNPTGTAQGWRALPLNDSVVLTLQELDGGRLRYTPGGGDIGAVTANAARVEELDWRTDRFTYTVADAGGRDPASAIVTYTVDGAVKNDFQGPIDPGSDADVDGISTRVESVLANRARGLDGIRAGASYVLDLGNLARTGTAGESQALVGIAYDGDLNIDRPASVGDGFQNAVTTFAWINNTYFDASNADPFSTDTKSVVALVAEDTATSRGVPDPAVQLRNVYVPALTQQQITALAALVQFTPDWSPMGFSAELRADAPAGTVIDHDPLRPGQQWRFTVDISRTGETLDTFMAFYKWIDQATIDAYAAASLPLRDLQGQPVTKVGWIDFTRVEPGGDGVAIGRSGDGNVLFLDYTITDNALGDRDLTPGRITDPGIPVFFTRTIDVEGRNDVAEGSDAVFTVTLNVPKSAPTQVRLSLADGTGADGTDGVNGRPQDYTPPLQAWYFDAAGVRQTLPVNDGSVVLPARLTRFFVGVPTVDDFELERREVFTLTATLPEGVADRADATILDDGSGQVYRPDGTPDPDAVPSDDRPKPPPPPLPVVPPPPPPLVIVVPAEPPAPPPPPPFNSALVVGAPAAPARTPVPVAEPRSAAGIGETLTSSSGFRVAVIEAPQPVLVLFRGITDQFVEGNRLATFNLPADAFAHTRPEAVLSLDAKLSDGRPLPGWMRFDAQAGSFAVVPPPGFVGTLEIRVTARDNGGREAAALFKFNVGQGELAPQPAPAPAPEPPRPQSRSGLSEQLRLAHTRSGGLGLPWRAAGLVDEGPAAPGGLSGLAPGDAGPGRPAGLLERILASRAVQERLAQAAEAAQAQGTAAGPGAQEARLAAPQQAPAGAPHPQAATGATPAGV
jgi:hypothetical protein